MNIDRRILLTDFDSHMHSSLWVGGNHRSEDCGIISFFTCLRLVLHGFVHLSSLDVTLHQFFFAVGFFKDSDSQIDILGTNKIT